MLFMLSDINFFAGYVLKDTFDIHWATTSAALDIPRYNAYLALYGLVPDVLVIEEGVEFDIYRFDLTVWLQILAFSLTPAALCLKKCFIGAPGFPL